MKTKYWVILICLILAVSLGLSLLLLPGEASSHAQITSNAQLVKTVSLLMDQEFTIEADGGYNVITIKDGKIAVTEASCPDHYCMQRGYCNSGTPIVCLPNKLVISFSGPQEIDISLG